MMLGLRLLLRRKCLLRCNRLWRLLRRYRTTCDIREVLGFHSWCTWTSWLSWWNIAWRLLSIHRGRNRRRRNSAGRRWGTNRRCSGWTTIFGAGFGGRRLLSFSSSFMPVVLKRRRWNFGFSFYQVWFVDHLLTQGCDFILNCNRSRRYRRLLACRNISLGWLLLLEHFTRPLSLRGQRICRLNHRKL